MAFIKRNLVLLSCGFVAFLSIVAIAVGMFVCDVSADIAMVQDMAGKLRSARQSPANDKHRAAAEDRLRRVTAAKTQVLQMVQKANERKLLVPGVFAPNADLPIVHRFQRAYAEAADSLIPNVLRGNEPPSQQDEAATQDQIAKEQREAVRKGEAVPAMPMPGASPFEGPAPGRGPGAPPEATRSNIPIEELAKRDARVRASLERARDTRCYCSPSSLSISEIRQITNVRPTAEQLWDAQMTLWIQQDILGAIARFNEATADRLKLAPEDRWVANLPVKDVLAIRFTPQVYVLGAGAAAAAGPGAAQEQWIEVKPEAAAGAGVAGSSEGPPGDASAVFTGRTSNALYDVIQFTVVLVIDARELINVVDALCGANFYTPLAIACLAVENPPNFTPKVYGPSPLMQVRIEFEGCFFRDLYHKLMPPVLAEQIVKGQRMNVGALGGFGGTGVPGPGVPPPGVPPPGGLRRPGAERMREPGEER